MFSYLYRSKNQDEDFDADDASESYSEESELDSDSEEETDENFFTSKSNVCEESVFLVYESSLKQLFNRCLLCMADLDYGQTIKRELTGCQLKLQFTCVMG